MHLYRPRRGAARNGGHAEVVANLSHHVYEGIHVERVHRGNTTAHHRAAALRPQFALLLSPGDDLVLEDEVHEYLRASNGELVLPIHHHIPRLIQDLAAIVEDKGA